MKATKLLLILVIVVAIFLFSLSGCTWGDNDRGGGSSPRTTPRPGDSQAYHLTATYGADQFHIQLTAIADSQVVGRNPSNP
jgi:hypothetical protein